MDHQENNKLRKIDGLFTFTLHILSIFIHSKDKNIPYIKITTSVHNVFICTIVHISIHDTTFIYTSTLPYKDFYGSDPITLTPGYVHVPGLLRTETVTYGGNPLRPVSVFDDPLPIDK